MILEKTIMRLLIVDDSEIVSERLEEAK